MLKLIQEVMTKGGKSENNCDISAKYSYTRPDFLNLTEDEIIASADHISRPIILPRNRNILPWNSGYSEVINAGKSKFNEDQCHVCQFILPQQSRELHSSKQVLMHGDVELLEMTDNILPNGSITVTYFGMFDGHAGIDASVFAKNVLHLHLKEKLTILEHLLISNNIASSSCSNRAFNPSRMNFTQSDVTTTYQPAAEELIVGALEKSFCEVDEQIDRERTTFSIKGGSTVLVVLVALGKLFIANAGDSRAVLMIHGKPRAASFDFTPVSERSRLQTIAKQQPHLLGNEFTPLEFTKRIHRNDIGQRTLYRDCGFTGWSFKTVTEDDLKYPLICGTGKQCRLLATIGVSRGIGDHDLRVYDSNIYIKPFLSALPQVQVLSFSPEDNLSVNDVLVMGTDGLWDVCTNEMAAQIVNDVLENHDSEDPDRYTLAAQELVMYSRGISKAGNVSSWKKCDGQPGSADDISVFVIPLLHCVQERVTVHSAGRSCDE